MSKMPGYKLRVYARVVLVRSEAEMTDYKTVMEDYKNLTEDDKQAIIEVINSGRVTF